MTSSASPFPSAVSRSQLLAAGTSRRVIDRLLRTGGLQPIFPGTYAPFNGPVPHQLRLEAAVLYAGPGAALSHDSAAAAAGWRRAGGHIHVQIAEQRRVRPQPGLVIHRSRRWSSADVLSTTSPPRTTVDRTLLDLIASATVDRQVVDLVTDAVTSRHTTPARVRKALAMVEKLAHRRLVLDLLAETQAGVHSPLERRFLAELRAHAIPVPRLQVREVYGLTVVYLDALFDPWPVTVELDGLEWHSGSSVQLRDRNRDNVQALRGRTPLRFGWANVAGQPCAMAATVAEALAGHGWPGSLLTCRRPSCGTSTTGFGGQVSA